MKQHDSKSEEDSEASSVIVPRFVSWPESCVCVCVIGVRVRLPKRNGLVPLNGLVTRCLIPQIPERNTCHTRIRVRGLFVLAELVHWLVG
jgi:hypothetical protein